MSNLVLYPTSIAQWYALVNEAESFDGRRLSVDLESYLVFLLQRYVGKPEIVNSVFALEYLRSYEKEGLLRDDILRDTGDKCLLFSGLFPKRVIRRRISISYLVELGQLSYCRLATYCHQHHHLLDSLLYKSLQKDFVFLMDLLCSIREMSGDKDVLSLVQAEDLWRNSKSLYALKVLQRHVT